METFSPNSLHIEARGKRVWRLADFENMAFTAVAQGMYLVMLIKFELAELDFALCVISLS